MASINKAIIIGNVGQDPVINTSQSGKRSARFSVATSERWKDKQTGEKRERTEWHNVSVLNDSLVTVIEKYVKKGSKLYVEGAMSTDKYTDKQGIERWSTKVLVSGYNGIIRLMSFDKREGEGGSYQGNGSASTGSQYAAQSKYQGADLPHEDMPF